MCVILQSLYKARENEIESEEHFKAIAERELGRVKDEIQQLEKEMETIRERKNDKEVGVTCCGPAPALPGESQPFLCDLLACFVAVCLLFNNEKAQICGMTEMIKYYIYANILQLLIGTFPQKVSWILPGPGIPAPGAGAMEEHWSWLAFRLTFSYFSYTSQEHNPQCAGPFPIRY